MALAMAASAPFPMRQLITLAVVAVATTAPAPTIAQRCPATLASVAHAASAPTSRPDTAYVATVSRARSALQGRQWANAAELLRGALETNALVPEHWNEYGRALYNDGQYRESVAAFERAIQLGGVSAATGSWNVARAYAQAGNGKQAYRWLARAFDEGFRPRDLVREEPAFRRYRDDARFRALSDSIDGRIQPRGERVVTRTVAVGKGEG
jgi:Tfp pilus assembly protein PilF